MSDGERIGILTLASRPWTTPEGEGEGAMSGEDLYVYECGPIDWWHGWSTIEQAISNTDENVNGFRVFVGKASDDLRELEGTALARFIDKGWEGDGEAMVTAIPTGADTCQLVIAVKQNNNGTTWIASEISLPWLDEWRLCEPVSVILARADSFCP